MKCTNCKMRYSATTYQSYPGGSGAPGMFLIFGAVLASAAVVLFLMDTSAWGWLPLGLAVVVLVMAIVAVFDCRGNGGYASHSGVDCPGCKTTNTVYPWSL